MPIPILFSFIFDKSCEIWQDNCGEDGSCWIYNSDSLAMGMFLAGFISKIISGTLFLVAVLVYKPPPRDDDITKTADHSSNDIAVLYGTGATKLAIQGPDYFDNDAMTKENGYDNETFKKDVTFHTIDWNAPLDCTHL